MVNEVKLGMGGCSRCGYNEHPHALDFHHRDPSTKKFHISQNALKRNWAEVLDEIAKCELICANCHRVEHATEAVS